MPWFAVRSVYICGQKADGTNVFEERVVCFEGADPDEAHAKAKRESERYAAESGFEAHPIREGYEQDGIALVDEYELWSVMLESRESLAEFYANRYARYDYEPD